MPYSTERDPYNYRQWIRERTYTVKQSVQNWTVFRPVDVTLTTAGTSQNLYSISQNIPTTNLITNPSFETNTTGWTVTGATIAQSADFAVNGTQSGLVNPDNAAAGEGVYFDPGQYPGSRPLAFSASIRMAAGAGNARLEIRRTPYTIASDILGNSVNATDNTQFTRLSIAIPPGRIPDNTNQAIRLYIVTQTNHNINFYIDSVQAETQPFVSPYADGAVGLDHFWLGTAHASESQRFRSIGMITGYRLYTTRDIYIAFDDYTASSTTGELIRAGSDFWSEHPVAVTTRISFVNAVTGELPRVYGSLWGTPDFEDS